jgi:hypothetical protein
VAEGLGEYIWPLPHFSSARILGKKYIGSFANDMKSGKGKLVWPDGSNYEGEFFEDEASG